MKKQLELQNLFVKPLPKVVQNSRRQMVRNRIGQQAISRESSAEERQRLEEQKQISLKIGQEIIQRSQTKGKEIKFDLTDNRKPLKFSQSPTRQENDFPRTCYSLENGEVNLCKDVHDEENDFILVLTDADSDEHQEKEVKQVVSSWAVGEDDKNNSKCKSVPKRNKSADSIISKSSSNATDNTVILNENDKADNQPKSFEELKKSFENLSYSTKNKAKSKSNQDLAEISPNLNVKIVCQSFEKLNEMHSRESSPPKAPTRSSSFYKAMYVSNRAKSPSSGAYSLPRKNYGTLRSTQRQQAFVKLERSLSNPDFSDTEGTSNSRRNIYGWSQKRHIGANPNAQHVTFQAPNNTKYSRAYLSLVKNGDVYNKLSKFEDVPERATIPAKTAAKLYRMPDIDPDYVAKHMTDNSKVVIKTKEKPDTNLIKKRLESKCDYQPQLPLQQQQQQSQDFASSTFSLQSKEKLKHLCKKIGHSKIIGKMVALQCAANTNVDEGTTKLWNKANTEEEYLNVYRSGKVESKVHRFETNQNQEEDQEHEAPKPQWAKGGKYAFSWSKRFGSFLPVPVETYTNAQRHNQFRKYYGYHPAETTLLLDRRSISPQRPLNDKDNEPHSLPFEIQFNGSIPKPPLRKYMTLTSYMDERENDLNLNNENKTEDHVYGKILPKNQRKNPTENNKGANK